MRGSAVVGGVLSLLVHMLALIPANAQSVLNDDYCDDGSDEPLTSACSGASSATFTCPDDFNRVIPLSRLHDGVCDCCDGADEVNSLWGVQCENNCQNTYREIRESVQVRYELVRAGLERRRTSEGQLLVQLKGDVKKYEALMADVASIKTLVRRAKMEMLRETIRERTLRFKLVRSRQFECATGVESMCDLFHAEYFFPEEMLDEGVPDVYENDKIPWLESQEDVDGAVRDLAGLTGYARVKRSVCPHRTLLPDDTVQVWRTVGEYLAYMNTTAGRASVKLNPTQVRKNTLLGPYLENGDKGKRLFAMHLCDLIGLTLLPVTAPLRAVLYLADLALSPMQSIVGAFASPFDEATTESHTPFSNLTVRAILFDIGNLTSSSQWRYVQNLLDPNRYSAVTTALDALHPYLRVLRFVAHIVYEVPVFYADVWYYGKHQQLPPKRQTCLLREGVAAAEVELVALQKQIKDLDELFRRGAGQTVSSAHLWEHAQGRCVSKEVGYNYEFCFRDRISQGSVLIGTYTTSPKERGKSALSTPARSVGLQQYVLGIIAEWLGSGTPVKPLSDSISSSGASSVEVVDSYENGATCFIGGDHVPR